jgi:hypothetical protein
MSSAAEEKNKNETPTPGQIIDRYRRRILGIRLCANDVVPRVRDVQQSAIQNAAERFNDALKGLKSGTPKSEAKALTTLTRESDQLVLHKETPHDRLICESLFKSAFGCFDAFIGALLRCLYHMNQNLLRCSDKTLNYSDLLGVDSAQDARDLLIEKEIDSLLRESYTTIFDALARRFAVKTLKEFPNWGAFVEASQRRNLITHCDGVVNRQYLQVCETAKVTLPAKTHVGKKLEISLDYLQGTLDVLYEVGFKLGQVLWRKTADSNSEPADSHLTDGILEILKREEWQIARQMTEFAVSFAKPASEMNKRTMAINHAQALRWAGDIDAAKNELSQHDWSGTVRDFRLAVAVLEEDFSEAARLMKSIGQQGELVDCRGYIDWPLFREFRKTEEFRSAFEEVYDTPFEDEVKKVEAESFAEANPSQQSRNTTTRKKAVKKKAVKKKAVKRRA